MKIVKHFAEWIKIKEKIHHAVDNKPLFKDGDIWWCGLGENVGIEVNGKGKTFSRPVLVFKKLSKDGFLGVPLTTKAKNGTWFAQIDFKGQKVIANLAQIRVIGRERLYNKMGVLDEKDFAKVKTGLKDLYLK